MIKLNEEVVQILIVVIFVVALGFGFTILYNTTHTEAASPTTEYNSYKYLFSEQNTYYSVVCLNGVEYHVLDKGTEGFMAVKYNRDGSISTC